MKKPNRVCLVCGKEYSYCPKCNNELPIWMTNFDNDNCRQLFKIASSYYNGSSKFEEVKDKLSKLEIPNKIKDNGLANLVLLVKADTDKSKSNKDESMKKKTVKNND